MKNTVLLLFVNNGVPKVGVDFVGPLVFKRKVLVGHLNPLTGCNDRP
jgi:hypothetical protein